LTKASVPFFFGKQANESGKQEEWKELDESSISSKSKGGILRKMKEMWGNKSKDGKMKKKQNSNSNSR